MPSSGARFRVARLRPSGTAPEIGAEAGSASSDMGGVAAALAGTGLVLVLVSARRALSRPEGSSGVKFSGSGRRLRALMYAACLRDGPDMRRVAPALLRVRGEKFYRTQRIP